MISIKSKAFILLLMVLMNSTIIKLEEEKEQKENRKLLIGHIALAIAGLLTGYLGAKYLTKESPIVWETDKIWEKRFLQISKNKNLTLDFVNLIIDSYGLELSNACARFHIIKYKNFSQKFKNVRVPTAEEIQEIQDAFDKNAAMLTYCDQMFRYVISHSFITKYLLNSNYSLFYFKMNFMDQPLTDEPFLLEFFEEMENEIKTNKLFEKIDRTHRNYFYITVNYLLSSEHNLKILKREEE